MDELIKKLEEYRLENRITQVQLGEKLKVSFSTISRWLRGKAEPNKIQTYHIQKLLEGETK